MTDKINGRTPEEIKKAVECCANPDMRACRSCPYDNESCCKKNVDTLAYIQQLEERVVDLNKTSKQLERERDEARSDLDTLNYAVTELHGAYEAMKRERDAAVEQLKEVDKEDLFGCTLCKHNVRCSEALLGCDDCDNSDCPCNTCVDSSNWQWRGPEVESDEQV